MRRALALLVLLFAANEARAQTCRGYQSFGVHRARAEAGYSDRDYNDYHLGVSYGSADGGFGTLDYHHGSFGGALSDFTLDGAEILIGAEISHQRLGPVVLCPLAGLGITNENSSGTSASSHAQSRSYFLGAAGGFETALTTSVRLIPSIDLQFRSDERSGSSTFSGTSTTFSGVRDEYLLTTVSLGVAFDAITVGPIFQRRFGDHPAWWGIRASYVFGSPF
jgi:hypothetical protein